MYPRLDYAKNIDHPVFDIEDTLLINVLRNSYGQPTMSNEDVKLAILSLYNTCKTQQQLIDELIECINDLRTPKKRRFFTRK